MLNSSASEDAAHKQRRSTRVEIEAEVVLRRSGQINYPVSLYDLSPEGCKLEFVERPRLEECVWVKLPGVEPLESRVQWVNGTAVGLAFSRAIHPAVYHMLLDRALKRT